MIEHQKILLIDHQPSLMQVLQIILKGQGYETILATTVAEAKMKIRIHKPTLILMDVLIEDQDGPTFCYQLKSNHHTNDIRIILTSEDELKKRYINWAGADDFIAKPYNYNELVGKVSWQMQHAAHRMAS